MDYAAIKVGEWVLYATNTYRTAFEVKRLTKTRIVVKDINFYKENSEKSFRRVTGVPVPRLSYDYSSIRRYATAAEIEEAKKQYAKAAAEQTERKRIDALTDSATAKLVALTGVGIRVRCWSTKEDGSRTFKIDAENLTEADLQLILSR